MLNDVFDDGNFQEGGHANGATTCLDCGVTISRGGSFTVYRAGFSGVCVPCCIHGRTQPDDDGPDPYGVLDTHKVVVRKRPVALVSGGVKFFAASLPHHLPDMLTADPMLLIKLLDGGPPLGVALVVAVANTVLKPKTIATLLNIVYRHYDVPSVLHLFHPSHPNFLQLQRMEMV
jgi:hypothetical protein